MSATQHYEEPVMNNVICPTCTTHPTHFPRGGGGFVAADASAAPAQFPRGGGGF
jgi:hypothetical protein